MKGWLEWTIVMALSTFIGAITVVVARSILGFSTDIMIGLAISISAMIHFDCQMLLERQAGRRR